MAAQNSGAVFRTFAPWLSLEGIAGPVEMQGSMMVDDTVDAEGSELHHTMHVSS